MIDHLDAVVGQARIKEFIRTGIKKDKLYNLFFAGPRGVGKRTMGFAVARTMGCPPGSAYFHLVAPIPSRLKEKKDKIEEYTRLYLPDNPVVQVEDRASILIEQIHNLEERLIHLPSVGRKRVVLILEADLMTVDAANCFLKTLEEPPTDTIFILTSSRPEHVLPTIRSRCRVFPFSYLGPDEIKQIVVDGTDDFLLGSAGEILAFRESDGVDNAFEILQRTPMSPRSAASVARTYERQRSVELFYSLLLIYRMVLYSKLDVCAGRRLDDRIRTKASGISLDQAVGAVAMLNDSIIMLERNPNRLLHLFYLLLRLP